MVAITKEVVKEPAGNMVLSTYERNPLISLLRQWKMALKLFICQVRKRSKARLPNSTLRLKVNHG